MASGREVTASSLGIDDVLGWRGLGGTGFRDEDPILRDFAHEYRLHNYASGIGSLAGGIRPVFGDLDSHGGTASGNLPILTLGDGAGGNRPTFTLGGVAFDFKLPFGVGDALGGGTAEGWSDYAWNLPSYALQLGRRLSGKKRCSNSYCGMIFCQSADPDLSVLYLHFVVVKNLSVYIDVSLQIR